MPLLKPVSQLFRIHDHFAAHWHLHFDFYNFVQKSCHWRSWAHYLSPVVEKTFVFSRLSILRCHFYTEVPNWWWDNSRQFSLLLRWLSNWMSPKFNQFSQFWGGIVQSSGSNNNSVKTTTKDQFSQFYF